MTVAQQPTIFEYVGDGVETNFYYPTRYDNAEQLEVYIDAVILPTNEWSATAGDENGGTVTIFVAPANQAIVRVQRAVPIEREFDYIQGGQLNAETLDLDIDRVVMMVQDLGDRAITVLPEGDFDAQGNKIINLATPENPSDAANKFYVDQQDALKADLVHTHLMVDITDNALGVLSDVNTSGVLDGETLVYQGGTWITVPASSSDHNALLNIGINTHDQIDTHLADATVHFTQASIVIDESQIGDLQDYLLDITGEVISDLANVSVAPPGIDQVLKWDGSQWTPADDEAGGGFTFPDAPSDGFTYGRNNALWVRTIDDITQEPLGDLLNVDLTGGPVNGQVLTYNAGIWTSENSAGGVTVFTGLLDTPPDYTGDAGKVLVVNNTEDGVEFIAGAGGSINSVFGRIGTVVAENGDYDIGQLTQVNPSANTAAERAHLIWVGGNWLDAAPLLNDNFDVLSAGATDEQVLTYIQSSGKWEPRDQGGGAVESVFGRDGVVVAQEGDYVLDQLGDVTIGVPSSGQILYWSNGINAWTHNFPRAIGLLENVDPNIGSGITLDDGLRWDGAKWIRTNNFATSAQGALADTALQDITNESIGDLNDVNTTGAINQGRILVWDGLSAFQANYDINDSQVGIGSLWTSQKISDEIATGSGPDNTKADKIVPAVVNNIAVLDGTGNLVDGGTLVSELAPASHTHVEADVLDLSRTKWRGAWTQTTYNQYDQVTDAGWLMIANKTTTDRAAPQPVGDPTYGIENEPVWNYLATTAVIHSGHTYTFTQGVWLERVRIWAPTLSATTNYRVILADITDPAKPIVNIIEEGILVEDGWATVAANSYIVGNGTVLRIHLDALNTGSSTNIAGGWRYSGSNNNGTQPGALDWNKDNQNTVVRINYTDLDSVNRQSELLGITPNSTILITQTDNNNKYEEYTVTDDPVDLTSGCSIAVIRTDSGGTIDTFANCTFSIDIPVAQSTDFVEKAAHWSNNPQDYATVAGFLEYDGVDQGGFSDSAFGIDLQIQRASISEDWDYQLHSGSGGSGGGDSGGGVGEAPIDGTPYARQDELWVSTINDITTSTLGQLSNVHANADGNSANKILATDGSSQWDTLYEVQDASVSANIFWTSEKINTELNTKLEDITSESLGDLSDVNLGLFPPPYSVLTFVPGNDEWRAFLYLDDAGSDNTVGLWSNSKIGDELDLKADLTYVDTELSGKSDVGHTHTSVDVLQSVSTFGNTNVTMVSAWAELYLGSTSATDVTITVDPNANQPFAVGAQIHFEQRSTGKITFVEGAGVTITSSESFTTRGQYSVVTLINTGLDSWTLFGDLEPNLELAGIASNSLVGHANEILIINGTEDGFDLIPQSVAPIYGTEYQYAQDISETTTTATTPQNKLQLVTPSLPDGTYEIEVNFSWKLASASQSWMGRLTENAVVINDVSIEPKDTTNYEGSFGKFVTVLTAGVYTYEIDFWSENGAQAAIKNVLLTIKRVA